MPHFTQKEMGILFLSAGVIFLLLWAVRRKEGIARRAWVRIGCVFVGVGLFLLGLSIQQ